MSTLRDLIAQLAAWRDQCVFLREEPLPLSTAGLKQAVEVLEAAVEYVEAYEAPCPHPAYHEAEYDAAMDRVETSLARLVRAVSTEEPQ